MAYGTPIDMIRALLAFAGGKVVVSNVGGLAESSVTSAQLSYLAGLSAAQAFATTGTITPDWSLGGVGFVEGITGNLVIANPSVAPAHGSTVVIYITGAATAYSITYGSKYTRNGHTDFTRASAGKVAMIVATYDATTDVYATVFVADCAADKPVIEFAGDLTATNAGCVYVYTGTGGHTVTMYDRAGAVGAGESAIYNRGSGAALILSRAGADNLYNAGAGGSITSYNLTAGSFAHAFADSTFICIG